jgi:nitrogen fixation/metabolism regulation signal transduction histidine kinase
VLALSILLLANLLATNSLYLTVGLVSILAIIQVISLIRFINKTNNEVNGFFESLKNQDLLNPNFSPGEGEYYNKLVEHYYEIINKLKALDIDKNAKHQYLKTIVQHVGIGIITFNKAGEVQIINTAAKRLFGITHINNINELSKISESLVNSIKMLKTGGRDLIKIINTEETIQLAVFAIELTLKDEEFKLVSVQNIQSELEENEMEAWQKLVRVLTHEIMNSVTPISSLANTVEEDIKYRIDNKEKEKELSMEDMEDLHLAIKTIQKRSEGLIRFVTDFRSLTHIPKTKFTEVVIKDLFEHIELLMKHEIEQNQINYKRSILPPELKIKIDQELIEQVLINLIKNAIQALNEESNKDIALSAFIKDNKHIIISVKDNGPGIDEEAQSKIFIPFYTTKKSGSGIGLSLSKQIMRQHLGTISVKSKINEGTEFVLRF